MCVQRPPVHCVQVVDVTPLLPAAENDAAALTPLTDMLANPPVFPVIDPVVNSAGTVTVIPLYVKELLPVMYVVPAA